MMWDVFNTEKDVHVAPCKKNGEITSPHRLDTGCACLPESEKKKDNEKSVVVHNQIH